MKVESVERLQHAVEDRRAQVDAILAQYDSGVRESNAHRNIEDDTNRFVPNA